MAPSTSQPLTNLNKNLDTRDLNEDCLCFYCTEAIRTIEHLSTHFEVLKDGSLICHFCPYKPTNEDVLLIHIQRDHDKECYICKIKFYYRADLIRHLKSEHQSGDSKNLSTGEKVFLHLKCKRYGQTNVLPNGAKIKRYMCDECPFVSSDMSVFWRHIECSHMCKVCKVKVSGTEEANAHAKCKSEPQQKENEADGLCFYCPVPQQTLEHVSTHFRVTEEQHFSCHFCPFKARRLAKFWIHLSTWHNQQCYVCTKRLPSRADVLSHLQLEHGEHGANKEPTFKYCFLCKKIMATDEDLVAHRRKQHAHQCPYCPKIFAYEKVFKNHLKLHSSGESVPSVQCSICSKMIRSSAIDDHQKRHAKKETFCTVCQKTYMNLYGHVRLEHKPRICPICGKEYAGYRRMNECRQGHSASEKYYSSKNKATKITPKN